MWHAELENIFDSLKPQEISNKRALQGILLRIEPLTDSLYFRRVYNMNSRSSFSVLRK